MLELTLIILAIVTAGVIVWFGARRSKAMQQLSGQLSGPVEQMQEQILLTADTAVDRLDSKIAQMEILLAEIDRRSNNLAQQSQQFQMRQLQLEQQQQQLKEWLQKKQQQLDNEFELRQHMMEKNQRLAVQANPSAASVQPVPQTRPALEVEELPTQGKFVRSARNAHQELPSDLNSSQRAPVSGSPVKQSAETSIPRRPTQDKRSMILELAEQGWSESDIAQKMGIGKGEVMLLLKLRKKTAL